MPKLRFLSLFLFKLALVAVFTAPEISHSAPSPFGIRRDGKLDQPAISKAYKESDWDQVTTALEGYLRRHGDSKVSPEERIFAYKYLGVIYAADSLSRTKAESYFTRLLNLSPKVAIVDLFPSKRVNDLFREMKREHEERLQYTQEFDTYGRESDPVIGGKNRENSNANNAVKSDSMPTLASRERSPQPIPARNTRETQIKSKSNAWVWWTVGIAAAAGAGAGAYYLTSQDPGKKTEKLPTIETP